MRRQVLCDEVCSNISDASFICTAMLIYVTTITEIVTTCDGDADRDGGGKWSKTGRPQNYYR